MPVEIAMSSFRVEKFAKKDGAEIKTGELDVMGTAGRQEVLVKVYRTSLEHFAVIYPQAKNSKPSYVLNLKNTRCQKFRGGFILRQNGFDTTTAVQFLTDYPSEIDSWVAAFTWKAQQRPALLEAPILEEDEETYEEEPQEKKRRWSQCRPLHALRQCSMPILLEDDEC